WKIPRTAYGGGAYPLLRQRGPDLSGFRVVVVARNRHRVLAEQHELKSRLVDALLAVNVVRGVEPGDEHAWAQLLLVEDPQPAFVVVVPVAVEVPALDDTCDAP